MLEKEQRIERLAHANMWGLLAQFSWPALVSMTLNALYNVIDRFYIGQGCGMDAIAGLALTFPIMMLFAAFGIWIGVGSGALLSIKLGENDRVAAEKVLGQCVALKIAIGLVLPPLFFLFLDPVLRWTGGENVSPQAIAYAKQYLRIVLFFQLFAHLAFGLANCIRSEGSPRKSMTCMIVGFGINLVLDPIFIFGFRWGVAGAAWATNVAMTCSCLWALFYYLRQQSIVRLRLRRIWFYPALAARAFGIGLAPFLQQFTGSVINFSMNYAFAKWAVDGEHATISIASFGIFQTVGMMCFMPMMGVQQGIGPIIGYNWGARNLPRVREAFLVGLKATSVGCFLAWAVQVFASYPLARCFVNAGDQLLLQTATHDMRVGSCMLWLIGLNVICTTFYQSIGKPRVAILLSLLRQGICLLPCIWFLPYLLDNHTLAIWLALPLSDTLCCLASIPVFIHEIRQLPLRT